MNYRYLAATDGYSCGSYGASTYGDGCTTQTEVTSPDTGFLGNVGYEVILPAALGLAVIIAALIALGKKMRRNKHQR